MFDATKGQQAVTDQVETRSDEFAARFNELKPRQQLTLLEQFNQLLDSPDQVSAFQAGTYAQNSAGQPAAQLGTGTTTATPTSSNAQEGLQAILDDNNVDSGIKQALKRLLTPRDPAHIPVGRDGTPSEIVTTKRELATARAERDQLEAERDTAREELTNERDVNRNGSLAKQLADITAERDAARAERDTARATSGGYDQAAAHAKAEALHKAIRDLTSSRMSNEVAGKQAALDKFGEFARSVGLRSQP